MAQGPFLIFDKSSIESLNLDEAIMLDNFYSRTSRRCFSWNALPISKRQSAATARRSNLSAR